MNCPWNRPKLWGIKPVSSSLTVDCLPVPALALDCRLLAPSRRCVGRAPLSDCHRDDQVNQRAASAPELVVNHFAETDSHSVGNLGHPAPYTRHMVSTAVTTNILEARPAVVC